MTEPFLDRPADWTGHWWLPDEQNDQMPGVLTFDPQDGLSLSLIGGFEHRILEQSNPNVVTVKQAFRKWPVLHGLADGKAVTLLNCQLRQAKSQSLMSVTKQTLTAEAALVGCHLNAEDETIFIGIEASVENLTLWSGESVFNGTIGVNGDRPDGTGAISAEPVEPHEAELPGMTAQLARTHTLPYFEQLRSHTVARMRDTAFVRFTSPEPRPMSSFLDVVSGMRDLVSLATHSACAILWQRLIIRRADHNPTLPDQRVSYYCRQIAKPDSMKKAQGSYEILFSALEVPFERVVPAWFKIREQFAATCNMVLGLRYVTGSYVETQVATAVGAAEAMHRSLRLGPLMAKAKFDELRQRLLDAVPEEHHSWLNGVIRNEPSLKQRLLQLAARPEQEAIGMLLPNRDAWVMAATEARNKLAHTGRSKRQTIDELYAVVQVTVAVVILNLLHEIGVPAERLREVLVENRSLTHAVRLSHKHFGAGTATPT